MDELPENPTPEDVDAFLRRRHTSRSTAPQKPDEEVEIERGRAAEALLANPLLCEVLERIEATILRAWRHRKPSEREEREDDWRQLRALDTIVSVLTTTLRTGKMAETTVAQRKQRDGTRRRSRFHQPAE